MNIGTFVSYILDLERYKMMMQESYFNYSNLHNNINLNKSMKGMSIMTPDENLHDNYAFRFVEFISSPVNIF